MIADWMLERYRLNELSAADRARVDAALAADQTLRARLDALARDDAATLAAHPAHRFVTQVKHAAADAARRVGRNGEETVHPERSRGPLDSARGERWLLPAFALMAAAVLGVVALRALQPTDDEVRFKGEVALRLFRLAGENPERLLEGATVKPHDVVQVAFELQGAPHLVIVSVDGAGHATLHWPTDGNTAVPAGFKTLPQAFELDEAPGFERFFLVSSGRPLPVAELLSAAERASRSAPLAVPEGATMRSVLLQKVTP